MYTLDLKKTLLENPEFIYNSVKNEEILTAIYLLKDIVNNNVRLEIDINKNQPTIHTDKETKTIPWSKYISDLEGFLYKKPNFKEFQKLSLSIDTLTKEEKEFSKNYINSTKLDIEKKTFFTTLITNDSEYSKLQNKIKKLKSSLPNLYSDEI